jgi:hypothetical protein
LQYPPKFTQIWIFGLPSGNPESVWWPFDVTTYSKTVSGSNANGKKLQIYEFEYLKILPVAMSNFVSLVSRCSTQGLPNEIFVHVRKMAHF